MQPIYSQFNANYSVLYQVGEHLLQWMKLYFLSNLFVPSMIKFS